MSTKRECATASASTTGSLPPAASPSSTQQMASISTRNRGSFSVRSSGASIAASQSLGFVIVRLQNPRGALHPFGGGYDLAVLGRGRELEQDLGAALRGPRARQSLHCRQHLG